jgi:hypothetical protein
LISAQEAASNLPRVVLRAKAAELDPSSASLLSEEAMAQLLGDLDIGERFDSLLSSDGPPPPPVVQRVVSDVAALAMLSTANLACNADHVNVLQFAESAPAVVEGLAEGLNVLIDHCASYSVSRPLNLALLVFVGF